MKQKNAAIVGLDIGSHSIKLVEIKPSGDGLKLEQAQVLPVSGPHQIDEQLKALFPHASEGRVVRIAIAGASLLVRRIQLPQMTPVELKNAIRFEAETHIPFPIDECFMDYQILSQKADDKTMSVLLVAAKRDFIHERLRHLEEAGLQAEIIDTELFSLMNAFDALRDKTLEVGPSYGLLNIGHRQSSFVIVHDHEPFFTREMPLGAQSVTAALAQSAGISETEAETLKQRHSPDDAAALKAASQQGLKPLSEELATAVEFFENTAGEELKHIWISGGGALSADAEAVLTEDLGGRAARLWDPTRRLNISEHVDRAYLQKHQSQLAVALGLALPRSEAASK